MEQRLIAILPCKDIDAAQAFFERLGFQLEPGSLPDYRMLADGLGGELHLSPAVEGWLDPDRNPFALYLCRRDVDAAAAAFAGETLGPPEDKPWGTYEFALDGPDGALVRVGWPSRLRRK
ncbi:putative enzyme related to lactoylglutathione lyase [Roseiarcus fermentans]|uniref:Putative enzyme related to lactoylglutathione lyase n=1 Tax=Roseiarcus fermentans TaxID=1473586 RepID=A0A366F6D3_9HYPH|nr:glyoxalase [Roseiarcus fermentans]RBP09265.1 putative enzyme related to lactoylglutathione lyase [Roseiarcus fermentans]